MNALSSPNEAPACPEIRIDGDRLEANLRRMQEICTAAGVELRPHIKTHKSVAIARRQLELGAVGLTCAKLSEAEAILPSGARSIFVAHSLVTGEALQRVAALQEKLEEVVVAVTSVAHARVLVELARAAKLELLVAVAVDTGLGREGLRSLDEARELQKILKANPHVQVLAIYTHEGHAYTTPLAQHAALVDEVHQRLMEYREIFGGQIPLWPGCSATATLFAGKPAVGAVRPGAYPFGDLYLSEIVRTHRRDEVALSVRSRVIDLPASNLALIDAGSKTFSGDKTPDGVSGAALDGRDLRVTRVSEEHGFVTGRDVAQLRIGDMIDFIPAHVCPVVNLAQQFVVFSQGKPDRTWPIEAARCNY